MSVVSVDATGRVIALDVTWGVAPRPGKDTVRTAALARVHAAAAAVLPREFGQPALCRGGDLVWRRDSLWAAVLPPERLKRHTTMRHGTRADYAALARRNDGAVSVMANVWREFRCEPPRPAPGRRAPGPSPDRMAAGRSRVGAPPPNEALQLSGTPGTFGAPATSVVRDRKRAWTTRS